MEAIAIIVGIVLLVTLAMLWGVMREKRRDAAIALAGEDASLAYARDGRHLLDERFTRFGLFQEGRNRRIKNVLQGHHENIEVVLFDYRFTSGSDRNASTHHQSVAVFHLIGQDLPEFSLRPENVLHKIGALLGYQDIDFEEHPQFSAGYLLRGPDEPAVRELFQPELREFFRDRRGWCVEGGGDWLIAYRRGKRIAPTELAALLKQTFEICTMFAIR